MSPRELHLLGRIDHIHSRSYKMEKFTSLYTGTTQVVDHDSELANLPSYLHAPKIRRKLTKKRTSWHPQQEHGDHSSSHRVSYSASGTPQPASQVPKDSTSQSTKTSGSPARLLSPLHYTMSTHSKSMDTERKPLLLSPSTPLSTSASVLKSKSKPLPQLPSDFTSPLPPEDLKKRVSACYPAGEAIEVVVPEIHERASSAFPAGEAVELVVPKDWEEGPLPLPADRAVVDAVSRFKGFSSVYPADEATQVTLPGNLKMTSPSYPAAQTIKLVAPSTPSPTRPSTSPNPPTSNRLLTPPDHHSPPERSKSLPRLPSHTTSLNMVVKYHFGAGSFITSHFTILRTQTLADFIVMIEDRLTRVLKVCLSVDERKVRFGVWGLFGQGWRIDVKACKRREVVKEMQLEQKWDGVLEGLFRSDISGEGQREVVLRAEIDLVDFTVATDEEACDGDEGGDLG